MAVLRIAVQVGFIWLVADAVSIWIDDVMPLAVEAGLLAVIDIDEQRGWLLCLERCQASYKYQANGTGQTRCAHGHHLTASSVFMACAECPAGNDSLIRIRCGVPGS